MLIFESYTEIRKICHAYDINDYSINSDGTVDVYGDVDISFRELTEMPLKFRYLSGTFHCDHNHLTTLEGVPVSVSGNFFCDHNHLTTLEGAPQSVGNIFWCNSNDLTDLAGSPKSVGGGFYCDFNPLSVIREMFPTGKEFFNANKEWEFFAGDNKIRKLRFKEALLDYDIQLPESIPGYEYI
jgi:hypothetical protein